MERDLTTLRYQAASTGTGTLAVTIEELNAAQRALDAEREKVKELETELDDIKARIKSDDSLLRAYRCNEEQRQQLATLQAQLARWKEALGEWLWNCTNLLGDYHIKTVQDFNEEVNRRIAWLMQHLDHTLPPPMTDEERDRMRRLSEDYAALQTDNECKDSLIETLQAQLPAEMPGCTILFKECEKGHGRLTATNWIDHGCGTCTLEQLQAQLAELRDGCEMMTHTAGTFQELWRGACDQREAMEAQLRQVEGERNTARHRVDELESREIDVEILQGDLDTLQAQVEGLEQGCFIHHVDKEQAEMKIALLEGTIGMRATERIDLLSQLENTEAQLRQVEGERDALKLVNETHMKTVMKLSSIVEKSAVLAAQDAGKGVGNGL